MFVAIDFDSTIAQPIHYPGIGEPVPLAFEYMKEFQAAGAQLILWTMRSGEPLKAAVEYCRERGIEFFGINCNPTQSSWTDSPKAYAAIYIDDCAFGCPLIQTHPPQHEYRLMVDWSQVGPAVMRMLTGNYTRICPTPQLTEADS